MKQTTTGGLESLVAKLSDEFLEALERGERPDAAAYAARFPEHAETLRQVLSSLEALQLHGDGEESAAETLSGCLGDFRIVREVGRGGMGIVYEAEQISLGRRVALKVLPFAAALDAKQLQRFRNEAHAAACLHHQNIVPVYSVGYERGVHYYAMQFIDGRTVAEMIHDLRRDTGRQQSAASGSAIPDAIQAADQPTIDAAVATTQKSTIDPDFYRTVARLGVQAAEALEHAHQLGVVHRDVKPANLLVDPAGNLWITDFGLARAHGDPALTMTGDLVGTLRYMSPEQALTQRGPVDHRSDIYSLGVTLYELLALAPVFDGKDRHQLLRQIADQRPRPPRQLNPAVPAELETIVLKAMAPSPDERYASAQELADDLERFLYDRPILAKRPGLWQRARSWRRRHRIAVAYATASAAIVVLGGSALLALSAVRLAREEAQTRAALALAEHRRDLVEQQRDRGDANFQKALQAFDSMLNRRLAQARTELARRAVLEDALRFYEDLTRSHEQDERTRYESGWAYARMGTVYSQLGRPADAERAQRQGLALLDAVAAEAPAVPRYRSELAGCCAGLGDLVRLIRGQYVEAEALLRRAVSLSEQLVAEAPANRAYRAQHASALQRLGYLQGMRGQSAAGIEMLRRGQGLLEVLASEESPNAYRLERAGGANSLGLMLRLGGRPADAVAAHRQAVSLLSAGPGIAAVDPTDAELARTYAHLGFALAQLGRRDEAEQAIRKALAGREALLAASPLAAADRQETALIYTSLAALLQAGERLPEAEQAYRRAVAALQTLAAQFPGQADFRRNLGLTRYALGALLHDSGRRSEAAEMFAGGAAAFAEALALTPESPEANNNFAWCLATCPSGAHRDAARAVALARRAVELAPEQGGSWNTLGVALYRTGDDRSAVGALDKSMSLRRGGDPFDWLFLAMAHRQLGNLPEARRWYEQSLKWLEQKQSRSPELRRFRAEAQAVLSD